MTFNGKYDTLQRIESPFFSTVEYKDMAEGILTFLHRELELCRRLTVMSRELLEFARAGQFAELDAVMRNRAAVLLDLQNADAQLRVSPDAGSLSAEDQSQGGAIAGEIAELLQQISRQDVETEKLLQEQKQSVLNGLRNLNIGKSMDEQYRSAERGAGGSFVDVRE